MILRQPLGTSFVYALLSVAIIRFSDHSQNEEREKGRKYDVTFVRILPSTPAVLPHEAIAFAPVYKYRVLPDDAFHF